MYGRQSIEDFLLYGYDGVNGLVKGGTPVISTTMEGVQIRRYQHKRIMSDPDYEHDIDVHSDLPYHRKQKENKTN